MTSTSPNPYAVTTPTGVEVGSRAYDALIQAEHAKAVVAQVGEQLAASRARLARLEDPAHPVARPSGLPGVATPEERDRALADCRQQIATMEAQLRALSPGWYVPQPAVPLVAPTPGAARVAVAAMLDGQDIARRRAALAPEGDGPKAA